MSESPAKTATTSTSPKGSPSKEEVDAATEALNHFAQGKRHLLVGDVTSAVNSLQEACRMLAEQHGETSPECGDAYFYYGKALLDLARMENGVLGNALDGVPEGDDMENSQVEDPEKMTDGEREEVSEEVGKALEENFKELSEKDKTKENGSQNGEAKEGEENNGETKENGEKSKDEEKMEVEKETKETKDEAEAEKKEGQTDEDAESQEDDGDSQEEDGEEAEGEEGTEEETKEGEEGEKTEEDEEEVSNLQLSWEMLELAKVIYEKQKEEKPEMKKKIAQVFLKLGEVGLESENYTQSVEDFKSCLKIQEEVLQADDRCIAETHYQLGVANSFADEFDLAIECFSTAVKIIETRISNLETLQKEKEGWSEEQKKKHAEEAEFPLYTEQGEIDELNQILPEMKEKVTDMEEMKKDSKERVQKALKESGMAAAISGNSSPKSTGFDAPSTSSADGKVNVITSLVRKKRKPEDEPEGDEQKKAKAANGEAVATNGSSNGASKDAANGESHKNGANGHTDAMDTDAKENGATKDDSVDTEELKKKAAEELKQKSEEMTA